MRHKLKRLCAVLPPSHASWLPLRPCFTLSVKHVGSTRTVSRQVHERLGRQRSFVHSFAFGASPVKMAAVDAAHQKPLHNVLANSRSPYVRGHMHNPVAWQMWSPETLELAKKQNKLLFISIGYAACHCTPLWESRTESSGS